MAGGLINIVSYVSNDLYLTGSPQITFYKMVYRRYTNFSMESVYLDFDDDIKFDHESELVPPRIADLLHKSYLHISIPSINISSPSSGGGGAGWEPPTIAGMPLSVASSSSASSGAGVGGQLTQLDLHSRLFAAAQCGDCKTIQAIISEQVKQC